MTIAMKRNDEAEDEVVRILKLSSDGFGFRTDQDNGNMWKAIQAAFCQGTKARRKELDDEKHTPLSRDTFSQLLLP